ncbi:sigma-54-dependent Fis family transcriptional regulator [Pelagibacterales bacterium SAG-MED31]|nr:sigma-54-dependent Fis family transcriptional regulator [Pelagibacterales bacterium SAG-MED31]
MLKILIVDDEKDICFLISEILKDEKYLTFSAINSSEAISHFNQYNPDLVILDVWLSNSKLDGIEILKEFKKINNNVPVIIISGHGTVDLAVSSIKNGAYDFLEKPFNSDKLVILVKRAIESSRLIDENKNLKELVSPDINLVGKSNFINQTKKNIVNFSKSNSRLLIEGSFGVGKKLIANKIHQNSKYKNKIPIYIDFATLNESNLQVLFSEDIKNLNDNLFIRSNMNTLILSNIDQIPLKFQKQFLFFIENTDFFNSSNILLDQKIITISEKNLKDEIDNGNFLFRLYERIKVDHLKCPSLSERVPDILPILNYYISKFNSRKMELVFSNSAISKLEMFDWPGNVAQLVNYIEKTVILNQSSNDRLVLDIDNLALEMGDYSKDQIATNNYDLSLKDARMEFEKEYLLSQIKRFNGNITKVSEFTGMERTALYRKLKSLNISVK